MNRSNNTRIAVVGATGLVGTVILKVLAERGFSCCDILAVASARSRGKTVVFADSTLSVITVEEAIAARPQYAIFSAGGATSLQYAPLFNEVGCVVIDNSSAWRAQPEIPLVVPQVNGGLLKQQPLLVANPNCSTIQLVMALAPLHHRFQIKRVVISTYQSVTGTGVQAVQQLHNERAGKEGEMVYPCRIDMNLFPHGGNFEENGYTTEETKLLNETRKILNDNSIQVTATVVRVPVMGGHSEAVNIEFLNDFNLNEVTALLARQPGITIMDDPNNNLYPTPEIAEGKDDVFVGRIRRDFSQPNTLNLWIVADNLRKGAATNAVEILEVLLSE